MNLIIATDNKFGFSKAGAIPWYYSKDLLFFKTKTLNNVIIMGKNTFLTLKKPLVNRVNIVVSSTLIDTEFEKYDNLFIFSTLNDAITYAKSLNKEIFICGGLNIYNQTLENNIIDNIYLTYINNDYNCDLFININSLYNYKINTIIDSNEDYKIYHLIKQDLTKSPKFPLKIYSNEFTYLNNLSLILSKGTRNNTRNGYTYSIFAPPEMKFNLLEGFPLLTTKKMFWKGIVLELIMFINGITDSEFLSKQGIKIWDLNTTREFLDNRGLIDYKVGDMGPMYGWNWRHFGAEYKGCDFDYTGCGYDQLENLINLIKTDPSSRRLLLTTFDPSKVSESVLPPCHSLPIQFYISGEYIDCKMTQRSADMFLGVPFNIASTSLFLSIIAKLCGYKARYVVLSLGDAHIYEEHLEKCMIQLRRAPMDLCNINITKELNTIKDIETLVYEDIELLNYKSHGLISAKMVA